MPRRTFFKPLIIAVLAAGLFSFGPLGPAASVGTGRKGRPPRPWPLDIPIHLSSSFGEYRSGHLHAGVDIRTFGREGVPCRAVGDGWISRLRSSPFGYGQAVYLTLATGETVVYAHLSEFSPALESVVYAAQEAAGRYRVDIYRDPGELPVRAGEILGYTGRTGSAAPHLHFEVRDGDQNPMDPLSVGWELEDSEPPRIHGVGWIPVAPSARVGGVCAPVFEDLEQIGVDRFAAGDTIRLEGRVGVSARIVDRLGPSSGRLAPYRVELLLDDRLIAAVELKSFTYNHTGEVELAYDMERARAAGRHYLLLFRRDGETLWNRFFENGGVIDTDSLTATVHTAVVRAVDRGGNISTARLPFVVGAPPPARAAQPVAHGADGELPGCFFLDGLFRVRGDMVAWGTLPKGETPEENTDTDAEIDLTGSDASSFPGGGSARGDASRGTDRTETAGADWTITVAEATGPWAFGLAAGESVREIRMFPVKVGSEVSGSAGLAGGGDVFFAARDGSFYSDTFVYLTGWPGRIGRTRYPRDELVPASGAAQLGPLALVCKGSIEIAFTMNRDSDDREAVYEYEPQKKEWSFVPSFVRADIVSAYIGRPGVFAVFCDTMPPRIDPPRLTARTSYATGKDTPVLVIPIADEGSGLDYEDTAVYIDDVKQIARWDGFLQKMFVLLRNQNIIGEHDLRVIAVDRVGNTSENDSKFHVPPASSHGAPAAGGDRGETKHNAP